MFFRVAFLIGGVARGFDRERMRRSFLQHVVEPLAPDPANRAFFVALKVLERSQQWGKGRARFRDETNVATLKAGVAAQLPGAGLHLTDVPVDREVVVTKPEPPLPPKSMEAGFKPHPCNCTCFEVF